MSTQRLLYFSYKEYILKEINGEASFKIAQNLYFIYRAIKKRSELKAKLNLTWEEIVNT